jgi:hypothetical protein
MIPSHSNINPRCALPACSALFFLLLAGCGDERPPRVPVSGRVLIDDKPLECGFLKVSQQGNRSALAPIGPDGRFVMTTFDENDGCVLGKHRVAVVAKKELSDTKVQWFTPKKYANVATSGLEIDVSDARDNIELHLTWQGSGHDRPFTEKN